MHRAERERVQRLLDEMGLLNDRLTVAHRASMKELARNRHQVAHLQRALDEVAGDGERAAEAEQELTAFLRDQEPPA